MRIQKRIILGPSLALVVFLMATAVQAQRQYAVLLAQESIASAAAPRPQVLQHGISELAITALATNVTLGAPLGAAVQGDVIEIRVKDNGTARTIGFNAIYRASPDLPLPTTTAPGKTMYLAFKYNEVDTRWDLVGKLSNF
jgi:hypothetical protein